MERQRYHHHDPAIQTVRLVICYKNFAAHRGISHIGLGVSALNTSRVLRSAGFWCDVWPIVSGEDLEHKLHDAAERAVKFNEVQVSHVYICAPWIPTDQLVRLTSTYPNVTFSIASHSNVGFLFADANGVKLLREAMIVQDGCPNFHISGNSSKFCRWMQAAYGCPCHYLPNLYFMDEIEMKHAPVHWPGAGVLRIGAFGAVRPLKNLMTGASAALEIAGRLKADTELWLSANRIEGGGAGIMDSIQRMCENVKGFTIKMNAWEPWPTFRKTVGHMNLLLQPSYTESFNMVTADGVFQGIPSVVSHAIDWAPSNWKANVDDPMDVANVAIAVLRDPSAPAQGLSALNAHNAAALRAWENYLVPVSRSIKF